MFLQRSAVCLGILTVILLSLRVQTNPVASENTDLTYQNDEDFKREIREKIEDLHKNKGKLFDRILMVNGIHKRWKTKYQLEKRDLNSDNVINNINKEDDNLLFEGDIVLDPQELLDIEKTESYRRKRNAVHRRKKIWTTRQIPYYLDPGLTFKAREAIIHAMAIIHAKTCVRWVPYTSTRQKHYVHFKKGDGCFSTIGRAYAQAGGQTLSMGDGCESVSLALHEMTHCMGFFHEQSRDDRNKYIKILWQNIPVGFRDQFAKYSHGTIDKMKKDYDIRSLMHYSSTAWGRDGKTTIVPIDPTQSIGDAETYTALDIVEINALYDCKTLSKDQRMSSWSLWSECDKNCYKERQRFCFSRNQADCPNTNVYGIQSEYVKCSTYECPAPIDGNWAMWSSWSACSKICDEGKHQRTRQCNRPAPSNAGKACIGESNDVSTCLNRRCKIGKYDADFEDGWNIWFSASNQELIPWTQLSGGTKTMNTGPRGDHTLQGKGNYVYVESSRRQKGDKAMLGSRMLDFSTPQCMSFYYNMYGELTGKLTLHMAPEGRAWFVLFSKTGNQGQDWHNADVTLDWKGKFQLIFEVEVGGTGYSDTALDDIFIDNGACPGYECKDDNSNCQHWASTDQCAQYPGYMHINCRVSCGVCTKSAVPVTVPKKCEDANTNCNYWSRTGQCQKHPGFMHSSCKASCGLCGDCKDIQNKIQCGVWAKQGYCSTYVDYMMTNCKQSCTGCPSPCLDDNTECPRWATIGECKKTPDWMAANCKKSCKKC